TPLLLANGWRLHTPITDLHRLVYRHAWRTKKKAGSKKLPASNIMHPYTPSSLILSNNFCNGTVANDEA
ncbi:hypothetical protein GA0116948_12034, partial [Chitinophaga costaii]